MGIPAVESNATKPVVLVIGTTGQVGKLIVDEFDRDPGDVRVRYAARKPTQVDELRAAGRDAVRLDLDDPRTFAHGAHAHVRSVTRELNTRPRKNLEYATPATVFNASDGPLLTGATLRWNSRCRLR
ncbi:hypothetical protein O4328_43285 [Rhodococcus opacus]|uniref:NmrA-like domain-containing protein n=1 Tax=Rhodococcus opacus TaxID=37919 RepID=A0AAX3YUW6_RHOOP|nr:hypothetical protein [Rhodococcus opacus]MCZ4590368.1 hypothetical protein [Rhodococcus opacus]WLF51625.1 hypothetical protein Q5707_39610 [Rhodococcus opacus]WLF52578.1 hypothetical protein Q5707_45385 [Rhodococcus opacus]